MTYEAMENWRRKAIHYQGLCAQQEKAIRELQHHIYELEQNILDMQQYSIPNEYFKDQNTTRLNCNEYTNKSIHAILEQREAQREFENYYENTNINNLEKETNNG